MRWRAESIFMRSLATRREHLATSAVLQGRDRAVHAGRLRPGDGRDRRHRPEDTEIVDLVDLPLYVMTSEYGAASQLEKIDMLDFAELIVLNKIREARRGGLRCATCASSGAATIRSGAQIADARAAGVSDHRQPLQRSGRQSPVRRGAGSARRARQIGKLALARRGPVTLGATEFARASR